MQAADATALRRSPDDRVPRVAPVVAILLLGALVFCAWRQVEEWPLSGWELFSRLRHADQHGWLATMDTGSGEQPIPFERLPRSFHNAEHVMEAFPALDDKRRLGVCGAWLNGLLLAGYRPGDITVYRTTTHAFVDGRPPTITRQLYWTCKVAG